jgi:hypothetical protein
MQLLVQEALGQRANFKSLDKWLEKNLHSYMVQELSERLENNCKHNQILLSLKIGTGSYYNANSLLHARRVVIISNQ